MVDGASLGFLRIGFGLIVAWEGIRYLDRGWVDRYYGGDEQTFTYWPFDAVQPLPEPFRALPWMVMILAGLWLASGIRHRAAAALCLTTVGYTLLLDKSQYLNHMYLMALLAFLLVLVPAGNALTLARRPDRPVPELTVDLIAFQLAVPYVFGGVAKLSGEWLAGRPLVAWLAASGDVPLLGPILTREPVGQALAVASTVFDLTVVWLLLWRRTRAVAFLCVVAFHVLNARLFSIGVFPWLMILATTIFLPCDWPRRVVATLRDPDDQRRRPTVLASLAGAAVGAWFFPTVVPVHVLVSAVGFGLTAWLVADRRIGSPSPAAARAPAATTTDRRWRNVLVGLAAAWIAIQVTVPLRHHLASTDVLWSEDGHRFSWRMKLRDKDGTLALTIREPDGTERAVDLDDHLRPRQIDKMATRPDMIIQFARSLEADAGRDIAVHAESFVSLNGREPARFVLADVDLTEVDTPWLGSAWYLAPPPD
ncbi:MAG: HTTM domain-containing protein [Actinomycetota bacterium]